MKTNGAHGVSVALLRRFYCSKCGYTVPVHQFGDKEVP